jgi:hypothetical protein
MNDKQAFDAGRVASLATEIAEMTKEAKRLRQEAERASGLARSAETRLHNKQSEFTRAVESQLDTSILPQPRRLQAS